MKVILKQDIKGIGKTGEIINTSDGHARNYLFPRNLAVEANAHNMTELQAKKDKVAHQKQLNLEASKKIADKLKEITLKIGVKVGENGKIFGGVTSKDISEKLKTECKIDIDKKKIHLEETIKVMGVYTVNVKLDEGVIGKLKVNVVGE